MQYGGNLARRRLLSVISEVAELGSTWLVWHSRPEQHLSFLCFLPAWNASCVSFASIVLFISQTPQYNGCEGNSVCAGWSIK